MAITLAVTGLVRNSMGNKRLHEATVTPSGTYVTGGFSFTPANVGLYSFDTGGVALNAPSGYQFEYVASTGKVKISLSAAHTHDLFLKNAAQADAANNRVNAAASNKLGANTGADITVVGVTNTAGNGGVVQAAASALSELANGTAFTDAFTVRCIGV